MLASCIIETPYVKPSGSLIRAPCHTIPRQSPCKSFSPGSCFGITACLFLLPKRRRLPRAPAFSSFRSRYAIRRSCRYSRASHRDELGSRADPGSYPALNEQLFPPHSHSLWQGMVVRGTAVCEQNVLFGFLGQTCVE